ncbi:MAG: hypothetical protein ACRD3I_05030 [Terriglobales bacterium]
MGIFGKPKQRDYDQVVAYLREHGFDLLEAPGTANRIFLKKHNCSAAIEKDEQGGVRLFAKPGHLIAGEISKLIDRGYQKFLKTSKSEVPASADHLRALHHFSEELKEALGAPSLYNESLGTVSDCYVYDRVEHRDEPAAARPPKPWEAEAVAAKSPSGKRRA